MNIAIIGSRHYPALDRVRLYVETLPSTWTVVTGGAQGVDAVAEQAARTRGLACIVLPARWETLGRAAGLIRNSHIVEQADRVVAFWDLKSRGTKDTINKALLAGKPVAIYPPPILLDIKNEQVYPVDGDRGPDGPVPETPEEP